jgi:hypothetical protein
VQQSAPSRQHRAIAKDGGQFVLVWVGETLIGSCYMGHDDSTVDVMIDLTGTIRASRAQSFFLVGDWNMEPAQNGVATALEDYPAVVYSNGQPTRWDARRCIDYGIGTTDLQVGIQMSEEKWSDHKLMFFDLRSLISTLACDLGAELYKLAPTSTVGRLAQVKKDDWQGKVAEYWCRSRCEAVAAASTTDTPVQEAIDGEWTQWPRPATTSWQQREGIAGTVHDARAPRLR